MTDERLDPIEDAAAGAAAAEDAEAAALAEAAAEELHGAEHGELEPGSAGAKIMATLRELSQPAPDAAEIELGLASVAMALERSLPATLAEQEPLAVDTFVLGLVRFVAQLRSDRARELVVVELPRFPEHRELPAGTRLRLLEEAVQATREAGRPI